MLETDSWVEAVTSLLDERAHNPKRWHERRRGGVARARLFTWTAFADQLTAIYDAVARGHAPFASPEACPA